MLEGYAPSSLTHLKEDATQGGAPETTLEAEERATSPRLATLSKSELEWRGLGPPSAFEDIEREIMSMIEAEVSAP